MVFSGSLATFGAVLGALAPGERVLWNGPTVDASLGISPTLGLGVTVANFTAERRGNATNAFLLSLYLSAGVDVLDRAASRGEKNAGTSPHNLTRAQGGDVMIYLLKELGGALIPIDVERGDADVATPAILGAPNGIGPDVFNGGYLNVGASATFGAIGAIVHRLFGDSFNNSIGVGILAQGFGFGFSVPDISANFGALPSISASVKAGISINITPAGNTNVPSP